MPLKKFMVIMCRYKLCCHAKPMTGNIRQLTQHHLSFSFSPEMEEIRNKMLSGEKLKSVEFVII